MLLVWGLCLEEEVVIEPLLPERRKAALFNIMSLVLIKIHLWIVASKVLRAILCYLIGNINELVLNPFSKGGNTWKVIPEFQTINKTVFFFFF